MLDDPGPSKTQLRHPPTYILSGLTELHKELSLIEGDGRRGSPSTRTEPGPRHRSTVCPRVNPCDGYIVADPFEVHVELGPALRNAIANSREQDIIEIAF